MDQMMAPNAKIKLRTPFRTLGNGLFFRTSDSKIFFTWQFGMRTVAHPVSAEGIVCRRKSKIFLDSEMVDVVDKKALGIAKVVWKYSTEIDRQPTASS